MSMDAAIAIVWDVLKMGFDPIKRGFGYVMSSKNYADNLRQEVGKLDEQVVRVGHIAERARNNCRDLYPSFTRWEDDAMGNSREAQRLLDDFDGATKTCCYGRLPDPKCRYQFSKGAKDKIEDIKKLAREGGEFKELNDISYIGPPPGRVTVPNPTRGVQSTTGTASASSASTSIEPREDGLFESRALMIDKVMDALANTSDSVVGIYGMGGVGKSTLLVDIEKRIRKERSFDWVARADVLQNPDIKKIQREIAHCLGLGDLENGEDVRMRAQLLHKRLEKEKKVLIILDDLWETLDLKTVGIPCGHDNKATGCKLLLTSRDESVLRRKMRCDSAFRLEELEKEEAKRLFEKMVGGKVEVELEPLVEKALHICAGFPFLILQMATLFIHTSYSDCEDALKQIWHEETGGVINKTLQLSYGRRSDEEKSLLRLCVAYGVSEPSLEDLARCGFGLGIFREVSSVQDVRNRLRRLIHDLQASSLLLDGDKRTDGFKIHDLVREFVASFASPDRPLLVLKDNDKSVTELSEDKLKSCEAMCFPSVHHLEELPEELVCPELRIFLLRGYKHKSLEISDSYFNSTKNLMALHLTGIRLTRSPSPFQCLEKLRSLCLHRCSLEDVAILGELKGLQTLSLRDSDIQRLPKEIGQLAELKLLDLNDCSQLRIIEPGVLGSLTKLEELYMEDSFHQWSAGEQTTPTNANLIELNNMKNLHTLHIYIPNPSVLPKDLDVEKLNKYRIRIGDMWHWSWSEYELSRTLQLKLNPTSDFVHKECIQSILCKTDELRLDECNGSEQSIYRLSVEGFSKLKHLQVVNSPLVCYILERSSFPAFKALETLLLYNLVNLEKICHNRIYTESFSTLKVVRVERCNKMEVLFPCSVVRGLRQLEELKVESCELMRGIVEADDDCGKLELPKLRVLKLCFLPNIENFFTALSSPSSSTSNDQVGAQIAFFNGQQIDFPRLVSSKEKSMTSSREARGQDRVKSRSTALFNRETNHFG